MNILSRMGLYHCYGFYEDDNLIGYAFFCEAGNQENKAILLDYLVMFEQNRGQGNGSKAISLIKEELCSYDYLIAEVEQVDLYDNSNEMLTRKRRQSFYKKNAWILTDLSVTLFGEELQIFYLPINQRVDEQKICRDLNEIYDSMFYEKQVRDQVCLK